MPAITCSACGKQYADHFGSCIHCAAPRTASGQAPPAPVAVAAPKPAPAPPPRAAAPPKPECPLCGDAPGQKKIRVETREYQGSNWNGMRRKYLVRWTDVPGVCAGCSRSLDLRRYVADVLINIPFVVFFLLGVGYKSPFFLLALLVYSVIVFKFSWGIGYLWADHLLFGSRVQPALEKFQPPGDSGTTRFPAGMGHCLVRLGLIPAATVALALVGGLFTRSSAAPPTEDPQARARNYLMTAKDIVVPVEGGNFAMSRINSGAMNYYRAYAGPQFLNSGQEYQLMTGPELVSTFLRWSTSPADVLTVSGPTSISVKHAEAQAFAAGFPPASQPSTPPLRYLPK